MTSSDDVPSGGTTTPLALQASDGNSQDEHESREFWASLSDGEGRAQERNATGTVLHQPPGNVTVPALQANDDDSQDDHESREFWASLGDGEVRAQERNAIGTVLHRPPGSITTPILQDNDVAQRRVGSAGNETPPWQNTATTDTKSARKERSVGGNDKAYNADAAVPMQ